MFPRGNQSVQIIIHSIVVLRNSTVEYGTINQQQTSVQQVVQHDHGRTVAHPLALVITTLENKMKITHAFVCRTALLGLSLMLQFTRSSGDPYPSSTKWTASTPWREARYTTFFGGVRHNDPLRVPSYRASDPVLWTRGGGSSGEEITDKTDQDEEDDTVLTNENDDDEEDELEDDEEDREFEEESYDEEDTILIASIKSKDRRRNKSESDALEYDEPYFLSPGVQIYTSFAPLLISRKIDMFHPRIVRGLRCVLKNKCSCSFSI